MLRLAVIQCQRITVSKHEALAWPHLTAKGESLYYHDPRLQYPVRVERPNSVFARMLQQVIGGVEGEIRVCLQYFFQAWGARGPAKYRDMLLHTATEEISHIEMLYCGRPEPGGRAC